jgi:DhnA family fructose-bisphosphate aldolase class Ia
MSSPGFVRRNSRIFQSDGKCIVVAMDHASFFPAPVPGIDAAGIAGVVRGGADAVMVPAGSAINFAAQTVGAGLILSANINRPALEQVVEMALRVGADAVKCMLYPWLKDGEAYGEVGWLGARCHDYGLPFMVETIPGGFQAGPEMRTPERLAGAARIGVELGATMIKTFFPGSAEGMAVVTGNVPVPVIVLGGERAPDNRSVLVSVQEAIAGGAAGVAIGRNIWQHPTPDKMTAAVRAAVHGGESIDAALKHLA